MWLTELLERNCQQRGHQPVVIDGDRRLTWHELRQRSQRLAVWLAERGLQAGDRFGVLSRNRLEVLESYFAGAWLGTAFVPLNHALTGEELTDVLGRVQARLVLGESELLARTGLPAAQLVAFDDPDYTAALAQEVTPLPPRTGTADEFAVLLTSATTGRPKAVVETNAAMRHMSLGWLALVRPGDDTVLLNLNPLSHGSIQLTVGYLAAGATIVLLREFSPQAALEEIGRSRVTHVWLVPQMLRFMLQAGAFDTADLSSLREVMHGAAPIPAGVLAEAAARFPCPLRNVYGMTEVGGPFASVLTNERTVDPEAWPAGRVIPGMLLSIRDQQGRPVPPGAVGEVCLRGPGLMREYWQDPAATAETLRDGWLHTGDLGWVDDHGYVHLVDRLKDLLIRGGQNVYPAEIERCLMTRPEVADAAVVGVPDEDWGDVAVAFLVLQPEVADEPGALGRIRKDLRTRLASYKVPAEYRIVSQIPRNGAGKALKRRLRDEYLTAQSEGKDIGRH